MPTPDRPPLTRAVVLRGIGFAAAIALGAVAVWLTVTSDSQKSLRIGMLVGLWGLLLGAYSMFGARRGMGIEASDDPGREIALRENRTLERVDDADARRDWEARLERLITREIGTAVGRETAALRNEIAHLRKELLDKVGGQLRLERIETTRVIGSDLEALQDEVRQLKDASGSQSVRELLVGNNDPRVAVRPVVEPARVRPVSRPTAEVEADVRPAVRPIAPTLAPAAPTAAAAQPASPQPTPETAVPQPFRPAEPAAAAEPPARTPAPDRTGPLFAPSQPLRPAQPAPAVARSETSVQRAPISHAAAQAAQSRAAGAAASQLGGPRRTDTAPSTSPPAAAAPPAVPSSAPVPPPVTPPVTPPAAAPSRPVTPAAALKPVVPAPAAPARQTPPQTPQTRQQPAPAQPRTPQQPTRPAAAPAAAPKQPAAAAPAPAKPAAPDTNDPFAALPRLSRFTDFELEPVSNGNGNGNGHHGANGNGTNANSTNRSAANGSGNGHHGANGNGARPAAEQQEPLYTGRRRRAADTAADTAGDTAVEQPGRHLTNGATPAAAPTGGGRRRRDEDADDGSELLARLLARETSER